MYGIPYVALPVPYIPRFVTNIAWCAPRAMLMTLSPPKSDLGINSATIGVFLMLETVFDVHTSPAPVLTLNSDQCSYLLKNKYLHYLLLQKQHLQQKLARSMYL
jgi:hypothetical protein